MSETKNVSKVPEITPELIAQNGDQQRQWRERFRVPAVSVDAYAVSVIADNLKTLDALDAQIEKARYSEHHALRKKARMIRSDTAVWLATLGFFDEAASITLDKKRRELYRDYSKAVKRNDSAWCSHPEFEYIDGQPSQIAYREFDFTLGGRRRSMIRCRKCGFRNAKDLPDKMKKLSEYRAGVAKKEEDVKSLAEIIS